MTTTHAAADSSARQTRIEADPDLPTVRTVRDFDAPRELVYRAHVDPDLIAQWLGPSDVACRIEQWDMRTCGGYRYTALRDGEEIAHFYGAVHRVDENERIVQTFGFEEMPEAVSLDTLTLHDLPGGRTRLEVLSVVYDMESRDAMLASGMETGSNEGYVALDSLLADHTTAGRG